MMATFCTIIYYKSLEDFLFFRSGDNEIIGFLIHESFSPTLAGGVGGGGELFLGGRGGYKHTIQGS